MHPYMVYNSHVYVTVQRVTEITDAAQRKRRIMRRCSVSSVTVAGMPSQRLTTRLFITKSEL